MKIDTIVRTVIPAGHLSGTICRSLELKEGEGKLEPRTVIPHPPSNPFPETLYMNISQIPVSPPDMEKFLSELRNLNPDLTIVVEAWEDRLENWMQHTNWLILHSAYYNYLGIPCNELHLHTSTLALQDPHFKFPFSTANHRFLVMEEKPSPPTIKAVINLLYTHPEWRILPGLSIGGKAS